MNVQETGYGSLLCAGEMLIDFTPVETMPNTYTANPGGAPANVAVSAARNGIKAGFLVEKFQFIVYFVYLYVFTI